VITSEHPVQLAFCQEGPGLEEATCHIPMSMRESHTIHATQSTL